MLLRAGLLYALGALCLTLGLMASWQKLELAASKDTYRLLTTRVERLTGELETARIEKFSAERRALVAEDNLARQNVAGPQSAEVIAALRDRATVASKAKDAAESRQRQLETELASVTGERDAARSEAQLLANEIEEARNVAAAAVTSPSTAQAMSLQPTSSGAVAGAQLAASDSPRVYAAPAETGSLQENAGQQPAAPAVVPAPAAPPKAANAPRHTGSKAKQASKKPAATRAKRFVRKGALALRAPKTPIAAPAASGQASTPR